MTTTHHTTEVTRRTLLGQMIAACVAFLAALLGIPAAVATVGPALRTTEAGWFELGTLDSFLVGQPKSVQFSVPRLDGWLQTVETKMVWVIRQPGAEFTVYNSRCTHLGCAVNWFPDRGEFVSPCHDGIFAPDGRVLGGPPPRPLDRLTTAVEGDKLMVQYRDFRLGVAQQVPL